MSYLRSSNLPIFFAESGFHVLKALYGTVTNTNNCNLSRFYEYDIGGAWLVLSRIHLYMVQSASHQTTFIYVLTMTYMSQRSIHFCSQTSTCQDFYHFFSEVCVGTSINPFGRIFGKGFGKCFREGFSKSFREDCREGFRKG